MSFTETVLDPNNLLTALVGIVTFATILTLASPLFGRGTLEKRMKLVTRHRDDLRRQSREALAKSSRSALRHTDEGFFKRVVDALKLRRLLEDPKVIENLAGAGFRGPRPVTTFYFFRFSMPFISAGLVSFYLFFIQDFGLPTLTKICACLGSLTIGFYLPNLYITNAATKRRDAIVAAWPDALDLQLICVESGMSIEVAMQKVGQEIGPTSIALAEELILLVAELSFLPERRMAYEGLAKRVNHPGIKSVATAMIQAERYGTPLGNALRVMAKENRELRLSAAEKKAAALPAQLTVPMILFFLPVLFTVILGPAIIKVQELLGNP